MEKLCGLVAILIHNIYIFTSLNNYSLFIFSPLTNKCLFSWDLPDEFGKHQTLQKEEEKQKTPQHSHSFRVTLRILDQHYNSPSKFLNASWSETFQSASKTAIEIQIFSDQKMHQWLKILHFHKEERQLVLVNDLSNPPVSTMDTVSACPYIAKGPIAEVWVYWYLQLRPWSCKPLKYIYKFTHVRNLIDFYGATRMSESMHVLMCLKDRGLPF